MPFIPEVRYIRYMEIGEIKQQMRRDLKENKLNALQKSLFENRPTEFLYDVENDIWEIENLAENPSYRDVLENMRTLLHDEIIKARDVMLLPEYESGILPDSTTAYEFRLTDINFPVADIYDAAGISGFRSDEIARQQIDLLSNSNKIIRYWAILGLRSQTSEVLKPLSEEIIKAMDDPYPPVSVTASAIAWEFFNNKIAEEKLKLFCLADDPNIALMTVNYLLYSSNKTPFIETIRKARLKESNPYHVKVACMDFLGILGLVPNNHDYRE